MLTMRLQMIEIIIIIKIIIIIIVIVVVIIIITTIIMEACDVNFLLDSSFHPRVSSRQNVP